MPSLLIHNANILSFHDGFVKGKYDSIALEGNKISAVGRFDELQSLIQPNTEVINAMGKTLMPGFNDTHIHIWKVGNLKTFMLDLRGVKSLDEMLQMLCECDKKFSEARWITARGFNEAMWEDGRIPTKNDLDKVSKDKPVYVIRTCAHIAVCNTKALEWCNINSKITIPQGGEIRLGEDGEPNGIFSETALGLIANHIPAYTKEQLKIMVKAVQDEMFSYGITAATDPAVHPELLEAYYEMNASNEIAFRLHAIPILLPDGSEEPYPIPDFYESDFFNVNTVKFFSDGGLSGKTAALKRHYKNSSEKGVLRLKREQYLRLCIASMEKTLGIATHAIGDAAIDFVIDVYKELHKSFPGMIKRIEHLGLPEEKNLSDMQQCNIAASMQTIFINELGKNFIRYLDEDYLEHCYPVRSVLKHGILTALSSDAPVVKNFNPMKGVEAAVRRKDEEGNFIAPDESISIGEALKAYTYHAAKVSNVNQFGSIEEGKLADFILLDKNPLTISPEELQNIRVEKTFVDGKCVWARR